MTRRHRRLYPRRSGFYDTVFSQPLFWLLVIVISGIMLGASAVGILPWE